MSGDEKFSVFRHWKTNGHVLLLIFLQILFICLFAQFVRYDPTETSSAVPIKTYFLKDEENNCEIVQKEVTLANGTVVKEKNYRLKPKEGPGLNTDGYIQPIITEST